MFSCWCDLYTHQLILCNSVEGWEPAARYHQLLQELSSKSVDLQEYSYNRWELPTKDVIFMSITIRPLRSEVIWTVNKRKPTNYLHEGEEFLGIVPSTIEVSNKYFEAYQVHQFHREVWCWGIELRLMQLIQSDIESDITVI